MAVPIIWLPLNGDFSNNGLDDSDKIVCPGAKFIDGKIGKCLSIESYQSDTATFNMLDGLAEFSFCCWLKVDSSKTSAIHEDFLQIGFVADSNTNFIRIEHIATHGAFQITFNKDSTGGSNTNNSYKVEGSTTAAKDKWCHIVVTNDGENVKSFLNGSLSKTTPVANIYTTGFLNGNLILGMSGAYGQINDLRIYDEALTQKQIRLLSQCLVMHYPLDNRWNESTVYDCSGYRHDGTVTGSLNCHDDSKVGNGCTYFNGNTNIKVKSINWNYGYKVSSFSITQWCKVKSGWTPEDCLHSLSWGNDFIRLALGKINFIWCYFKYIDSSGTTGNMSLTYGLNSEVIEDNWYFIALTFENGIFNLYLDGNLIATEDHSSEFSTLYYGSKNVYIGSYNASSEIGIGSLADIRAYSSALSASEILDLYQAKISTDDDGNVYCYGLKNKDGVQFWDTGMITCRKWYEQGDGSGGQLIET